MHKSIILASLWATVNYVLAVPATSGYQSFKGWCTPEMDGKMMCMGAASGSHRCESCLIGICNGDSLDIYKACKDYNKSCGYSNTTMPGQTWNIPFCFQ